MIHSTGQQDFFLDGLYHGRRDLQNGVTKGTTDKINSSFKKWKKFTAEAGFDLFLRGCDFPKRQVFSCFAYKIRHNYAGKTSDTEIL